MTIKLSRAQLIEKIAREVLGWERWEDEHGSGWWCNQTEASWFEFDPTTNGSDLDLVIDSVRAPDWITIVGGDGSWTCSINPLSGPDYNGHHKSRHLAVCLAVLSAHLGERVEVEE